MDIFDINTQESYEDFLADLDLLNITSVEGSIITTESFQAEVSSEYRDLLEKACMRLKTANFDVSGYDTEVVENQGFKFITFKG